MQRGKQSSSQLTESNLVVPRLLDCQNFTLKSSTLEEINNQLSHELLMSLHSVVALGPQDVRPQQAKGRGGTVGRVEAGFLGGRQGWAMPAPD